MIWEKKTWYHFFFSERIFFIILLDWESSLPVFFKVDVFLCESFVFASFMTSSFCYWILLSIFSLSLRFVNIFLSKKKDLLKNKTSLSSLHQELLFTSMNFFFFFWLLKKLKKNVLAMISLAAAVMLLSMKFVNDIHLTFEHSES